MNRYPDSFQSGFWPHNRNDTTLIKVLNDTRLIADAGEITILVLLDLSASLTLSTIKYF